MSKDVVLIPCIRENQCQQVSMSKLGEIKLNLTNWFADKLLNFLIIVNIHSEKLIMPVVDFFWNIFCLI